MATAFAAIAHRPASAQPDEEDPSGRFYRTTIKPEPSSQRPRLRFQRRDRDAGLPQNTVSSLVQDRTGFMWMATDDGLARYDGQRFLVFRHDAKVATSLSASFITKLLLAKDGTLWVGTAGGGVNRYHPENHTFDRFLPSEASNDALRAGGIAALAESGNGHIWVGTAGGGLGDLDPATGKVRSYSVEDGVPQAVSALAISGDGTIWLGSSEGAYRFDPAKRTCEPLFPKDEELRIAQINTLHLDADGVLWIGTDGFGLVRYETQSKKVTRYRSSADDPGTLAEDSVTSVLHDRTGRVWVGSVKTLHLLDPTRDRFVRHPMDASDPMSLPGGPKDIFEDAAGVLWIGTLGGGAALLDPRAPKFQFFRSPATNSTVHTAKELWASNADAACRWSLTGAMNGACYRTEGSTSLLVDRSGTVWVGTFAGLMRLDPDAGDRWTIYQNVPDDPKSLAAGAVINLLEGADGGIWIGFFGTGLQRFDKRTGDFENFGIPSSTVYHLRLDPKDANVLWVGTSDAGLLRLDLQASKIDPFIPRPNEPNNDTDNAVVGVAFEGDNVMWMATYGGGLKRYDRGAGQVVKSYGRAEGMPSDTLYGILRDKNGMLWMSSTGGLIRFDPKTEGITVFGPADGLQSIEFSLGGYEETKDGRFVFSGVSGFNIFKPEEIQIDQYKPPLAVTSIKVLNENYGSTAAERVKDIELAYDEGILTVDFAALSFSGSERHQFEYRVVGLSDRWFPAEHGSVKITGLSDGDYEIQMRARNRHGVASDTIALSLSVAPPLWRTWYAYATYGALVLITLFLVWRYQKARIDRLQKLARLATVEREFEVTAAVQSWFLPEQVYYSNEAWNLVGFYRGAEKCSGDWWWYEELGDGRMWIIVADVTGHGAGPAMLTAAVAMGLSVQSDNNDEQVMDRLARVNREVLIRCKGKATMTMTAVVVNQNTGEVAVYGLGGLPALHMQPGGRHSVIGASGTPLGSVENLSVGQKNLQLAPGDRLLITTDGIVETAVTGGRQLGFRRFVAVMRDAQDVPVDRAVEQIVRQVDASREKRPQEDDFTFCLLERRA